MSGENGKRNKNENDSSKVVSIVDTRSKNRLMWFKHVRRINGSENSKL